MRVAVAQMHEGDAARTSTVHVRALARQAKAQGADLVVFPELSLVGYSIGPAAIRSVTLCSVVQLWPWLD